MEPKEYIDSEHTVPIIFELGEDVEEGTFEERLRETKPRSHAMFIEGLHLDGSMIVYYPTRLS